MEIEVHDVQRLVVEPDETLVVRLASTGKAFMEAATFIRDCMPPGVRVLVLSKNAELQVVKSAEMPGLLEPTEDDGHSG